MDLASLFRSLVSFGYLNRLFPSLHDCTVPLDYETCVLAKIHNHSYFSSITRANTLFDLVNSDVWGPAPNINSHGLAYFVLFVDDRTRILGLFLETQIRSV